MLIAGAKGFAKEVLFVLEQLNETKDIVFYDDVSIDSPLKLYGTFPVFTDANSAQDYFQMVGNKFVLGIGGVKPRILLTQKLIQIGGELTALISPYAQVGKRGSVIGQGASIMGGVIITNDVHIGEGALIDRNATVGHDSTVGDFTNIMPGVCISGNCQIGHHCMIGTNSTILPNVKIGNGVTVGAGAVVIRDVPDGQTVVGVPAKAIRTNE